MEVNKQVVATTVSEIGIIEAVNDRVMFSLAIKAKADTLENVNVSLTEKVNGFIKELDSFKSTKVEMNRTQSNYKLEHREGSERYAAGFQAVENINFTVAVDENTNAIFETCLKFDTAMPGPIFSLSNREELVESATKQAAAKLKKRVHSECELLGVSVDRIKYLNWNFAYDGLLPVTASNAAYFNNSFGATGPQGLQGSPGLQVDYARQLVSKVGTIYQELLSVRLNPGKVFVRVAVQATYVWL